MVILCMIMFDPVNYNRGILRHLRNGRLGAAQVLSACSNQQLLTICLLEINRVLSSIKKFYCFTTHFISRKCSLEMTRGGGGGG